MIEHTDATKIDICKRAVSKLWEAVARGVYDSRSVVGDETLSMKEALYGDEWPQRLQTFAEITTQRDLLRNCLDEVLDEIETHTPDRHTYSKELIRKTLALCEEGEKGREMDR